MTGKSIHLQILSPDEQIFEGEVSKVTLPGTAGSFTVLPGHAPLISSLEKGFVTYAEFGTAGTAGEEVRIAVNRGFVEVKRHETIVCIERSDEK